MTPTKESVDVASTPAPSGSSQLKGRPRPESAHLRADAVSLEVPIKVHGSLVPNVVPGAGLGGVGQAQPFEESTTTMIVFPQGGVLKMSTAVSAGQVMVVKNLKSRQEAICRVVKVRAYGNGLSYVETEFTSPQPGYWGVYFPTDGPEVARVPQQQPATTPAASLQSSPASAVSSPSPQPPATALEQKLPDAPPTPVEFAAPAPKLPEQPPTKAEVRQAPVVPPQPSARPKLPESLFASIGTKEEVLAPADATRGPRASLFADRNAKSALEHDKDVSDAIDALIAPAKPAAARAIPRETGTTATVSTNALEPVSPAAAARPPVPKQMFGVMLDSGAVVVDKSSREKGGRWWIPFAIAAVLAVAAAGAYYFYFGLPANNAAASPDAPALTATADQPSNSQPAVAQPAPDQSAALQQPDAEANANAASDNTASESNFDSADSSSDSLSKPRTLASSNPAAVAQRQPTVAIPSTHGKMRARPIVARHPAIASAGAAPALNASAGPIEPTGSLSAIAPPPPSAPAAPKPIPNAPIRVGGKILPPQLVSSVLPVYPSLAQQTGVTGTVIIDTTIDKRGNVVKTRIISGPQLLRGAALSALRQWKYEPSKLDGDPISVEMVVSIQFH